MASLLPRSSPTPLKGRGALSNASGRFERHAREAFDDGWDLDDNPDRPKTSVTVEAARTIISTNDSPDLSFDQTINTYRGCEHGCVYCYARPNHAYVGLSPGLDFETRLFVKDNAAELLRVALAKPTYVVKPIVIGGVTDVYQPIERTWKTTRAVIEVLAEHRHPLAIVTKSALIQRDLDLLGPMGKAGLAKVAVSVTTLDPKLARTMEPRAAAPHRRLDTIRALSQAGVPTAVMTAPLIPSLNDVEIDAILEAAAGAGATSAGYVVLRLPLEISALFQEWLAAHAPDRAKRVMKLVREMRGGRDYDSTWGARQRGVGPYAMLIAKRFRAAAKRHGLDRPSFALDVTQFRRPPARGDQLDLFDTS